MNRIHNQYYNGIGFVDYYSQIVNKPMRCLTEFYPKCLIQTFYYFSILEILPDIPISKIRICTTNPVIKMTVYTSTASRFTVFVK